jgi:peptidoglycan hydrolase-like protein with peptidoglycan-binding domain
MPIHSASKRVAWPGGLALAAMLISACTSTPSQIYAAAQPRAAPSRSQTSFSESLTCMDDLLYDYGIRDVRITTNGLPDSTGEIQTGTRDMLIAAVSRMSARSRAFTFIDFEEVTTGFATPADRRLYDRQQGLLTPTYYIRGAITTFDDSVTNDNVGVGLDVGGSGIGLNREATSSVVGLDMNVGEVQTGLIVPGVASSNRIAVTRRSRAADASFDVEVDGETVGGFMQAAKTKAEGMHTAVRTLVELNTIETLGKLTHTPYWRCLGVSQSDPAAAAKALRYFEAMTDEERVEFVQRSLQGLGKYSGEIDGETSPELAEVVGAYQAENGLLATGRIDAQLYASLVNKDIRLAGDGKAALQNPTLVESGPERLFISLTDTLEFPTYKVGMPLQVRARLNADAYLYCYYQDGSGAISRIFPNRFQPDALVAGGRPLSIPREEDGFVIVFEQPAARERVSCFASRTEFGTRLPAELRLADLTPLPFGTMQELERAVRTVAPADLASNSAEFLIR